MILYRKWTASAVLRHIRRRIGKEPLNALAFSTEHPDVYAAAERIFGSWKLALEALGIDYATIRKYRSWTKDGVLAEIRCLQQEGEDLTSNFAQRNRKPLYMAAVRLYGNWGNALTKAGVQYELVRKAPRYKDEDIIRRVKTLIRKGEDMAYPNMRRKHSPLLALAMKRIGNGSWAEARKRCGDRRKYRLGSRKQNQERVGS